MRANTHAQITKPTPKESDVAGALPKPPQPSSANLVRTPCQCLVGRALLCPLSAASCTMAAASDAAAASQRLANARKTAASLPPLPLAVVHIADDVLRDLVFEVAETALHATAKSVPW